ncbi:MAG TPA: type II secretion system F family protein [Miltoncostaeaceae bacterium]|nr:type II secretion system F family protein [Miltoncostaeaceae bacterium]
MPPPLLVWAAAVAALLLGMRARVASAAGPAAAARPPAPLRVLARLPSPRALRARLTGGHGDRLARLAGLDPDAQDAVSRASAGGGVVAVAAAAPAGVVLGPLAALAVAAGLGALGIAGPALWLRSRARERRSAIVRQLPDLLDLLVICAEAGMALEPALRLAVARLPGALTAEIAALVRELDLGTPRRAAYRALAERVGSPELTQAVATLIQAEELGAPIAGVLARQAELLRAARRQLARDRAAQATPRVQLVVALVMVPGAMLLVLGVLVIELAGQVGAVVG